MAWSILPYYYKDGLIRGRSGHKSGQTLRRFCRWLLRNDAPASIYPYFWRSDLSGDFGLNFWFDLVRENGAMQFEKLGRSRWPDRLKRWDQNGLLPRIAGYANQYPRVHGNSNSSQQPTTKPHKRRAPNTTKQPPRRTPSSLHQQGHLYWF